MPRRESDSEFGARLARVRERLGFESMTSFAKTLGLSQHTYWQWEVKNSAPSMWTLKRAIRKLGVWGWETLLLWLADGEGDPPKWLKDEGADPRNPPPTPATVALQRSTLERLDEARREGLQAQAKGEIRGDHVFNVVRILKDESGEIMAALARPQSCGKPVSVASRAA